MVMDCGTALAVPGELVQGVRCSVQGGRWCRAVHAGESLVLS